MAELLKHVYTPNFISEFNEVIVKVHPSFDTIAFKKNIFDDNWSKLELKARMSRITFVLHQYLPQSYYKATTVIELLIDMLLKTHQEEIQGFRYMFLAEYVSTYGINDFDKSMQTIEKITQFTSCEFSIRFFIEKYPDFKDAFTTAFP